MIISTAEEMNPTKRSTMEDCHVSLPPGSWGCNDPSMAFLGVYDGHGGRDIVEFLEENMAENVARELNHVENSDGNCIGEPSSQNDDGGVSIHQRLERAFLITDVHSRMENIMTSGATVAICLIKKQPNQNKITIHSANVGDARAVLSCTSKTTTTGTNHNDGSTNAITIDYSIAQRLTHDHRADDPLEVSRIEQSGGFVLKNRVLGILAVARSLGDHGFKEFVIGRPHVGTVEIPIVGGNSSESSSLALARDEDNCLTREFVIIACDGLWDVLEDQEAVNIVRDLVEMDDDIDCDDDENDREEKRDWERMQREGAAQVLCNEALRRGSTDNITVVVAWL